MRFVFTVEVEVQRTQGKFASREEVADQIAEALSSADIGNFTCDNGGEYETCSWDVNEEVEAPKPKKAAPAPAAATEAPQS